MQTHGSMRSQVGEITSGGGSKTPHAEKVERICRRLRERRSSRPLSLVERVASHEVPKAGDLRPTDDHLDLSDLDEVLHIDARRRICVAEPGVTFEHLVDATMRHGLAPRVVPELKEITIGGAVSGGSIESTSFRYGGFHDTCLEYEIVTAEGEVLTCSPKNENGLLFQMMHGSFGTLGIITKLTFALMPAKPFVHLHYERYGTLADYQAAIVGHSERGDIALMDGFIHSPAEYVLAAGELADDAPYATRYDWLKVYYESTRKRGEDYLRLADYFFRYDHGVTNIRPKSLAGRFLFGKLLGSGRLLRLANLFHWALPKKNPPVTVDVFLPVSNWATFMEWYAREVGFFPLWCVPYRLGHKYEWLSEAVLAKADSDLYVDLAIYGMKQPHGRNVYKLLEDELLVVGGVKTLISHNYYSPDDFWRTWNRENYYTVKRRTDPNNVFRDIYTKTCRAARGLH